MTLVLRRHTGPRPPLYQTFTLCPGNPLRGRWILKQVDRRRVSGEVGGVLQRWPHRQRYGLAAAGSTQHVNLEDPVHGKMMSYLVVAGAAIVVGLLVAGTPARSALPLLLVLACPLMMIFMMRGMGGHNHGQSTPQDQPAREETPQTRHTNHH